MPSGEISQRKQDYFARLEKYFTDYSAVILVNADNVGSQQFHQIRMSLRGKAVILMGKNTMMRRAMRGMFSNRPDLEKLYPHVVGNVGMVFTNEDLKDVRSLLLANRVAAPARANALAPNDVFVPPQNTGMGPEKTSFFQALGISTKIAKGTIEILTEQHLVKAGDRVGPSEAALLNMLKISPFTYGLVLSQIFQSGSCFPPEVLDLTDEILIKHVMDGISNVAALSMACKFPTKAAVAHHLVNGYKKVLAVAVGTEYSFPLAEKAKEFLKNPGAFAAAPAPVETETKAAPKVEEKEESEDEDLGMGLFD